MVKEERWGFVALTVGHVGRGPVYDTSSLKDIEQGPMSQISWATEKS